MKTCASPKKARQYGVKFADMQGNALDLSRFADESFDAVFLMGPLYHLMNEDSRLQALREAARVLKTGGCLFSSFILVFGGVIFGLRDLPQSILEPKEQMWFDITARGGSVAFEAFTFAYMTTVGTRRICRAPFRACARRPSSAGRASSPRTGIC